MTDITKLKHIFREYDIRGLVDSELSNEFAYKLGRAYTTLLPKDTKSPVAIGYDCRLTSEGYAKALADGMNAEGVSVHLTGMGPTPQLYWALFHGDYAGGIQVTGSHNPSNMNGFKISVGTNTITGTDIQKIYSAMLAGAQARPSTTPGTTSEKSVRTPYIQDLIDRCKSEMGDRKLKIVVDAGNGVGGLIGPEVLRGLGVEVIELYCDPDGTFPNHHPDPTEMENIKDLSRAVIEHKADFGVGWDGDADRIGVVDENGRVIFGDMLMLLYARDVLKSEPGATIIADVKCSTRLFDDIQKHGGDAVMWKTGHSLVKAKLRETKGALAGEMSGHIFFKHRFYGFDDALYCTARLAELVSNVSGPLSSLLNDVPEMVSTPEIRLDCPEEVKFVLAEKAVDAFQDYTVSTIDGVRIEFEHGWGLIRASNTQPVLVMRFEAKSEKLLAEYKEIVNTRLNEIRSQLGQPAING